MSEPCVGALADGVALVGHHIGVVAVAAGHRVGAGAAIEDVVAGIAGEGVGERIAGAVDVRGAGQDQVLDIGAERVGDRGLHRVGAFAGSLDDDVAVVSTT